VPAGQPKNTAPSRSAAGKSASSEIPAHFPSLPIVTRRAKTTGLVSAAHRAGRPKGSSIHLPLFLQSLNSGSPLWRRRLAHSILIAEHSDVIDGLFDWHSM
jgi:hypothetical protein